MLPKSRAFDCVAVGKGPGIHAALERNPGLPKLEVRYGTLRLGVRGPGAAVPGRGRGLGRSIP